LGQAFLNIILNAADAIAAGAPQDEHGKISIATTQSHGWVEIRIADNGCGIPEEAQERIFDYFFTTKDVGKGSGQGLAICHNIIVKMHGGSIAVESREGAGTTFIIRLPYERSEPGVGQE
jgi:signal transduction histidine kinase